MRSLIETARLPEQMSSDVKSLWLPTGTKRWDKGHSRAVTFERDRIDMFEPKLCWLKEGLLTILMDT